MSTNPYASFAPKPPEAWANALPITPSDIDDLPVIPRGVYCDGSGKLKVTMQNGQTVTIGDSPVAGQSDFFNIAPIRIHATGTSATGIILFW